MKIIPNIPSFIKLIHCLKYLNKHKKDIENAKAAGDLEKEREHILSATSLWGPMVFKMFNSKVNVEGLENLPEEGPVVFVGNHQGYADIIAYCAAFKKFQFGFIAKDELAKVPLYGPWIERIRSVFIERDDPRASLKAINKGIEYINQGFSMVIFPEGTRSKGPEAGEFKKGALKLATKPGVPIIPVSLEGSYKFFEETGKITPAEVTLLVHPPIETKDLDRKEEKALTAKVEEIILTGVKELQNRK